MKTLSSPIIAQAAATQSGWAEIYDIYLRSSIVTPVGTTNILRITTCPGYLAATELKGLAFFAPGFEPEPSGTQENAVNYYHWPISRGKLASSGKFQNDKLPVAVSNVSQEWAQMLADVDWEATPIVIRKVSLSIAAPTVDDAAILFSGKIDSAKVTLAQITFSCSNDLGNFEKILPAENMHVPCRFRFCDDQCTLIKYKTENYKADKRVTGGGVPSSPNSTTTILRSNEGQPGGVGLTEDTARYPLFNEPVVCSAFLDTVTISAGWEIENNTRIRFKGDVMPGGITEGVWYFARGFTSSVIYVATLVGPDSDLITDVIDITSAGTNVTIEAEPYGEDLIKNLSNSAITASSEMSTVSAVACKIFATYTSVYSYRGVNTYKTVHGGFYFTAGSPRPRLKKGQLIKFASAATPLANNTYYPIHSVSDEGVYLLDDGSGGIINITGSSTTTATSDKGGEAYRVKEYEENFWRFGTAGDWGTNSNGYWQIPDAQAGLANAALKPYIQFDFGSAVTPKIWRVSSIDQGRESMIRLIVLFSSTNATDWTHETYFEMPPKGETLFDVLIPNASTARYWRICVRSRWSETLRTDMFSTVQAFEKSVNYWANGTITFLGDTTTVALRGLTRKIGASYVGTLEVEAMPVAPVGGDTFIVQRGCNQSFNACAERKNQENYGGFDSLPNETVVR